MVMLDNHCYRHISCSRVSPRLHCRRTRLRVGILEKNCSKFSETSVEQQLLPPVFRKMQEGNVFSLFVHWRGRYPSLCSQVLSGEVPQGRGTLWTGYTAGGTPHVVSHRRSFLFISFLSGSSLGPAVQRFNISRLKKIML